MNWRGGLAGAGLILVTACVSTPAPSPEADIAAIAGVLDAQAAAWNAGDIPGFMAGYHQSEDLRFASGGTVVRGWQPTLERYLARYDSAAKMGKLDFTDLEILPLGPDAAVIHGRWHLTRANDAPHGLFTLIARRIEGKWQIVSDTTTSAD
ncbi:MAG: nuclear transport factor 2 family protein [Hyphomonadaceae bacterium]|nr:nuclear transport factor 2 family protein [Hyphomonadaceae bacterium]